MNIFFGTMIEIQKATQQDIALINSLAKVIFSYTYSPILSSSQVEYMFDMMYAPHNIEQQMSSGHQYFIAYQNTEAVGYLSFRVVAQREYYIEKIYAIPSTHGSGVGRSLFEFACQRALCLTSGESCTLDLNVNRYNKRAIGFYTKMGMSPIQEIDKCVGSGYYANDYIMRKTLTK